MTPARKTVAQAIVISVCSTNAIHIMMVSGSSNFANRFGRFMLSRFYGHDAKLLDLRDKQLYSSVSSA